MDPTGSRINPNAYSDNQRSMPEPKSETEYDRPSFRGSLDRPTNTAPPEAAFRKLDTSVPSTLRRRLSARMEPGVSHVVVANTSGSPGLQRAAAVAQHVAHRANYGRAEFVGDNVPQAQAQQTRAGSPTPQEAAVGSGGPPRTPIKIGNFPKQRELGANATQEQVLQFKQAAAEVKKNAKEIYLPEKERAYNQAKTASSVRGLSTYEKSTRLLTEKQTNQDVKFVNLVIANHTEQECYANWRLAVMDLTKANEDLKKLNDKNQTPDLTKEARATAIKQAKENVKTASKLVSAAENEMNKAYALFLKSAHELQAAGKAVHKQSLTTLKLYEDLTKGIQKQLKKPMDAQNLERCITLTADIARKMAKISEYTQTMPDMVNGQELKSQQSRVVNQLKSPVETLLKKARENRAALYQPGQRTTPPTQEQAVHKYNWAKANSLVRMADVANYSVNVQRLRLESAPDRTILDSTVVMLNKARMMRHNAQLIEKKWGQNAGIVTARTPQPAVFGPQMHPPAGQLVVQPKVANHPQFAFRVGRPPEQRQLDINAPAATIKQYQTHANDQKKAAQAARPLIMEAQRKATDSFNHPHMGEHNKSTRQLAVRQTTQDVAFVQLVIANRTEQECYAQWLLAEKDLREARGNLLKHGNAPAAGEAKQKVEEALIRAQKAEATLFEANTVYQAAHKEWQSAATQLHTQSIATLKDYQSQCESVTRQFKAEMPTTLKELEECRASLISFTRIAGDVMKLIDYHNKMPNTLDKTEFEQHQNQMIGQLVNLSKQAETLLANARDHREALAIALKNHTHSPSQLATLKYNFAMANALVQSAKVAVCLTEVAALKSQERPDSDRLKRAESHLRNAHGEYVKAIRFQSGMKSEYARLMTVPSPTPATTRSTTSRPQVHHADQVLEDLLEELGGPNTTEIRPTVAANTGRKLSDAEDRSLLASIESLNNPMDLLDALLTEIDAENATQPDGKKEALQAKKEIENLQADIEARRRELNSTANTLTESQVRAQQNIIEAKIKLLTLKMSVYSKKFPDYPLK